MNQSFLDVLPLEDLRVLTDFGLFVLIWLVQLIIYPSFQYCDVNQFKSWHYRYTGLIALFVVPLMFTQLGLYLIQSIATNRWVNHIGLLLVLFVWFATVCFSIPCHDKLQKSGYDIGTIGRHVGTNWLRTIAWSITLGIDFAMRMGL